MVVGYTAFSRETLLRHSQLNQIKRANEFPSAYRKRHKEMSRVSCHIGPIAKLYKAVCDLEQRQGEKIMPQRN